MMQRRSILQNITSLTFGNVLVRPLWILFSSYATAEFMGVQEFGVFNFALYSMAIFGEIADFGTTAFITREVAQKPEKQRQYFVQIWLSKIILFAFLGLFSTFFLFLIPISIPEKWAIEWAILYWISFKCFEFTRAFFRAGEVMQYESMTMFGEKIIVVFCGLIGLFWFRSAAGTLGGMTLGMILALFSTFLWQMRVQMRVEWTHFQQFSASWVFDVYRAAAPLAWIGIITLLYRYSGIWMLRLFAPQELGVYGLALRIVETLLLFPTILTTALFPRFAQYVHQNAHMTLAKLGQKSLLLTLGISLLLAILTYLASTDLLKLYKPEYLPALPLLQIVIWVFPIWSLNMLFYQMLLAANDQKFMAIWMTLGLFLSFILNYYGTTLAQAYGTAFALLGCESVMALGLGIRLWIKHETFFTTRYSKHTA